MPKWVLTSVILLSLLSCKTSPDASRAYAKNVYRLRLHPGVGNKYFYEVSSETDTRLTVGDRKVNNVNRSNTGVYYELSKDTTGNLLFSLSFDKVHIYSKNDDDVSELDAANATNSIDPLEKMLGALTSARIQASVTPSGEVRSISGYKEMTDNILANLNTSDPAIRKVAQDRLDQMVGTGLVKNNMEQMFRIFPDSAVHIGDRWKLGSRQSSGLNVNTQNIFTLKKIEDGIAYISCQGEIGSDSATTNLQGYNVTANLKGRQDGEYQMNVHSGMLIGARMSSSIEGTVEMMGRQVPVTIEMKVDMKGHAVK